MTKEQIKNWIKEAHQNAVEKGFYDCPECKGVEFTDYIKCSLCGGVGVNPNKNIGELLMLIVSELGEAIEAHRIGKFVYRGGIDILENLIDIIDHSIMYGKDLFIRSFEKEIKSTCEDEITDVFIRIFDLCGYLEIEKLDVDYSFTCFEKNVGTFLLHIVDAVCEIHYSHVNHLRDQMVREINNVLWWGIEFCKRFNIPIENHIKVKMEYNKTRPKKHGKRY